MNYRIVEKPAFEAAGWAIRTAAGDQSMTEIPKFWDRCDAEGKVKALEPAMGGFGVLGLCGDFDAAGTMFTYIIGVEKRPGVELPEGTQTMRLEAASYAVFGCVGAMPDGIQNGWRYIMGEWYATSGYEQSGPVNFELYPVFPEGDERGNPASPQCYTEIWIPVKKKS